MRGGWCAPTARASAAFWAVRNVPTISGRAFGADLTGAEVRYLMEHEWAQTADDVLWRRSKLGLRFARDERARLRQFMVDAIGAARRLDADVVNDDFRPDR